MSNFKVAKDDLELRVSVVSHVFEFDVEGVYYYGQVRKNGNLVVYKVLSGSDDITATPLGVALVEHMKEIA